MNRRGFLTSALRATAAGVLVPEHLLDPLKGRSMVSLHNATNIWDVHPRAFANLHAAADLADGIAMQLHMVAVWNRDLTKDEIQRLPDGVPWRWRSTKPGEESLVLVTYFQGDVPTKGGQ